MNKKFGAHSVKCLGCGDDMVFSPEKGKLSCPSCNGEREIVASNQILKHDLIEEENIFKTNEEWANESKVMECPNCGASVVLNQYNVSENCLYCGTSLIIKNDKTNLQKPDAIIPFSFGKKKAEALFKSKIQSNFFVPKKFKENVKAENIQAFYFPAFIFDADCASTYTGKLYKNVTCRDSDGHHYNERKYFNISGTKNTSHSGIEVEAGTKLEQYELDLVRPYDFSKAKEYTNEYVSGYGLECNSDSVIESHKIARNAFKKQVQKEILKDYDYDGVSSFEVDIDYSNEKYSYCVLPLYRINYSHNGKKYSNVINGQTGTFGGNFPKSGWKIALCILLPILAILLPIAMAILL